MVNETGERLRDLRKRLGLTLSEAASEMTKSFPNKTKIVGNVLGKYETGKRKPSASTLSMLAEFYDVPVDYLEGESSDDGIIRYLMNFYNSRDYRTEAVYPWLLHSRLCSYLIGMGLVPYNVPSFTDLLSKDQASDFDFWKENFGWLVDRGDLQYLKDIYGTVTKVTFNLMLSNAIAAEIEQSVYPVVRYKEASNHDVDIDNSDFMKRIMSREKFLAVNTIEDTETDFMHPYDPYGRPHYGWFFTWEKGMPVIEIE